MTDPDPVWLERGMKAEGIQCPHCHEFIWFAPVFRDTDTGSVVTEIDHEKKTITLGDEEPSDA